MKPVTRRNLIRTGIFATAGAAGLATASRIAERYGLVPPDHGGIYGPGETLTYAAQRLITRHSLAREFPRTMISEKPFANEADKPTDEFKRHQAGGFREWRLAVDGMVDHPLSLSVGDIQNMAVRNQITEVVCEEGWSYVAEWIGTPLHHVLKEGGVQPQVRYIVY